MRRRLSVVWGPLVTVLLACPLFAGKPRAVSDRATLQAVEESVFPAARPSDPVARSAAALKTRPLDRQYVPWRLAQAAATLPPIFTGSLAADTYPKQGTPAHGSARPFPLFPTGPPLAN
jgi:hypothetical protein